MAENFSQSGNGGNTSSGIQASNGDWKQECGPLRVFLQDPTITEIMVNGPNKIFVERAGVISQTNAKFDSQEALFKLVQAMLVSLGREINRKTPFVDARLPDGSRMNCIIPPIALDGPILTIRKFSPTAMHYGNLITTGALDEKMLYFLNQAVIARQNMIISGGTGSGKTTLLNALSSFIPVTERLITIEDTAELKLSVKNLVRLECRPGRGGTAEGSVSTMELIKNALRMRPDRIIVGECRGAEVWDMLQAMNTGHEGSMTSIHANSGNDALRRLESMVLRAGLDVPLAMIRQDIADTVSLVIQAERAADGKRRVVEIVEVDGRNSEGYITRKIFKHDPKLGFVSTGIRPKFLDNNRIEGVMIPPNFFNPDVKIKFAA